MNKMYKLFLLPAIAAVGLAFAASPASAFWVDTTKDYAFIDPVQGPQGPGYTYKEGLDSQVFLNEVDPDWKVIGPNLRAQPVYKPTRAKYEIAAPNGTDLTGWKFQIFQGYSVYNAWRVHTTWHTKLVQEIDLGKAFKTGPKFTDQQQGWGFKSFEGFAPVKYNVFGFEWGVLYETENMDAHYVLVNDKNEVVQALSYRNTVTIDSPESPAYGLTTTSIMGKTFALRKSAPVDNEGSWKLNNVNLRPDSTYGSLHYVTGVPGANYNPQAKHWDNQWNTPTPNRHGFIMKHPYKPVWDQINFEPEDKMSAALCTIAWRNDWGDSFCDQTGDTGYFFDESGGGNDVIPPIANRLDKEGTTISLPIVRRPSMTKEQLDALAALSKETGMNINVNTVEADARANIEFSWLPDGITFNRETGMLEGKITKEFPRTKIVLSAKNPKFNATGYNGHGITYRTFFWGTKDAAGNPTGNGKDDGKGNGGITVINNKPPKVTVEPFNFEENVKGSVPITITDPENDPIVAVNLDGIEPKMLPTGLTIEGPNHAPRLVTDGTTPTGRYLVRIRATDNRGGIGTRELMVFINPAKEVVITVNSLVADSGEEKSVPITLKTNTNEPTSITLFPYQTPVPPGVYTKVVNGKLRMFTDGTTPAGEYNIIVRGTSDGIVGERSVYIRINDVGRPHGLNFQHATLHTGTEHKIPLFVESSGAVLSTITIQHGDAREGDFSIIEADTTRPEIIVNKDVKPGQYIIRVTAYNPNRPENKIDGYLKVRILARNNGPVIGLNRAPAPSDTEVSTIISLQASDPLGGAVEVTVSNANEIPAGIYVRNGDLIIEPGLPVGQYEVELTAVDTYGMRTVKRIIVDIR